MNAKELTLMAMKKSGCTSQNQLAKKLDVHSDYVSGWVSGRRKPDATYIGMLAELAGLDPWETMKEYEIQNEDHPGRKKLWEHLARAAIFLAVVSSFFATPTPSEASNGAAPSPVRCILCKITTQKLRAKIKGKLQRFTALFMQAAQTIFPARICQM